MARIYGRDAYTSLMAAQDHGRISTYNNYKCRCDACTHAMAVYRKKQRLRMTEAERRAVNKHRADKRKGLA